MSLYACAKLTIVLNGFFCEFHDVKATLEYVSRQEFFLYSPNYVKQDEWVAIIEDEQYIIWFEDGQFYVREK